MDAEELRKTLPGSWHLVAWEIIRDDCLPPSHPFGVDATGLLHYTDDGGMAACIARAGRAPLSSPSARTAPPAEQLAAFESFFHYAGSYRVQARDGHVQVVHSVAQSLNPSMVGSEQRRDAHLAGDGTLTLSARETLPGGGQRHHRLIWRR
ncbi:MAG: lipocalin-like domain-containing protein [Pararhodobacter sp.]